jgi:hypothetical protein
MKFEEVRNKHLILRNFISTSLYAFAIQIHLSRKILSQNVNNIFLSPSSYTHAWDLNRCLVSRLREEMNGDVKIEKKFPSHHISLAVFIMSPEMRDFSQSTAAAANNPPYI